ncbi:transmembrane protein 92-like isoform X3 [Apodemus sylvaticus]|uniref:transmembrane protein 92-like isoform X3 n=1 Tax=Apodemus sylvaticus TaxID=10129 RepID=UPI0022420D20|nr:transmembrane protein 92-like isoform X3 [Apodemus sylvaticus]
MKDSCVVGTLTLIFGLLSTLQGVSTNEVSHTMNILSCPKGFTCCDNECCPERKAWDPANDPFRFLVIILLIMVALLFIYGLLLECFPPTELSPPYSLRPEGLAGQMRGDAYATL